jgi:hypothetical protein
MNIEELIKHPTYVEVNRRYIRSSKLMARYIRRKKVEPAFVRDFYNKALKDLRIYLDFHGVRFTPL